MPTKKTPAARTAKPKAKVTKVTTGPEQIRDMIVKSLDDDKAEEIVVYDLVGRTSLTDYMVIATGNSARQVMAMANHLREKLEAEHKHHSMEGMEQGDWVLVDVGDVIVHLFRPEVRSFYQLERLWAPEVIGSPPSA